jgi:hypothetical protein
MNTTPNTKRWRPRQFNLKTFFVLVSVAGVASCLLGEMYRQHLRQLERDRQINATVVEIDKVGGFFIYGCVGKPPTGDLSFSGSQLTDEQLGDLTPHLNRLSLFHVDVSGCLVTEAGARRLYDAIDCFVEHPSLPSYSEQHESGRGP